MKEKIIELRLLGFSYNEISKKLNCSKSTISYHCSKIEFNDEKIKNNIETKNKKQIKQKSFLLNTEKVNEVIDLRKKRTSYKEIKNITNLSLHIISKICREYNLFSNRKMGKVDNDIVLKIQSLYTELKSVKKVSEIFNLSTKTISKYINVKVSKLTDEESKNNKVQSVISWRKRVKLKLIEYKGGKCEKCGYDKCVRALEFHHLDPSKKDFTISGKSWSYERLKIEVEKCILVCSNCHNEIHFLENLV